MTQHEARIALLHMLDAAREVIGMADGKTRTDLDSDRKLNLAIVRLLEIVGEAANRVPITEREVLKDIPWPDIVGLRNRLIHGYDDIDLDIVWQVVSGDLPPLISQLETAVSTD